MKTGRQPGEITFLGCTEEWRGRRVLGAEIVSEWYQHRDKPIASVGQGEDAKCIEHVWPIRDHWKQPTNVLFVDPLGKEGSDSKKPSGVRAKFLEHRRGERKFDRGGEAPGVLCVKHYRSLLFPFPGQSVGIPLVILGNSSEQGDREGVEVELFQDVIDRSRPFAMLVDAIGRVACGLHG